MDEEPTDEARALEQMIDRTFMPQASDTVRAMLREIRDGVPQQHIQWVGKPPAGAALYRRVIERYNRAHGQNQKITLKQVCAEMGVSYEAVRKYRQRTLKQQKKK